MNEEIKKLRDILANDHLIEPNIGATFRGSFKVGFNAGYSQILKENELLKKELEILEYKLKEIIDENRNC